MIDARSSERITINGACHCGAVQFYVTLTEGSASARRCNCSLCRMRGASWTARHPSDDSEHRTFQSGVLRFEPTEER